MAPACLARCPQICAAATEVGGLLPTTNISDIGALACKYRPELACAMEHQDDCDIIGHFTNELGKACDGTSEVFNAGPAVLAQTQAEVSTNPCHGNPIGNLLNIVAPGCMAKCPELCFVAAEFSIMKPDTASVSYGTFLCNLQTQVKCAAGYKGAGECGIFGTFIETLST